jgi:hypothetical protein
MLSLDLFYKQFRNDICYCAVLMAEVTLTSGIGSTQIAGEL